MGFWRNLFRFPEETRASSGPSSGVTPPPRTAVGEVSPSRALGLESVFRAVQVIETGVSQLSVDAYRNGAALAPSETASWLRKPNVDASLPSFLAETAVSLATTGNAFWRVYRSSRSGEVMNLRVLPPSEVEVEVDRKTDERTYRYGGETLSRRFIQHLSYLRMPGKAKGLGPIQAAQERLQGTIAIEDYASNWFANSGIPSGVLSSEQQLTPDQAEQWRDQWHQARRDGATAVLGAGLDYKALNLSPKDAQFIESQSFNVTAIARLFGIPQSLMLASVEGGGLTYKNLAQEDLNFVRWTLTVYLREIEEAFTAMLPRGQTARFDLTDILRPAVHERYEAYKIAIESGFLTINEVRREEGREPLDDPATGGGSP